jgi:GNAT superfamily N-acetyltransferase
MGSASTPAQNQVARFHCGNGAALVAGSWQNCGMKLRAADPQDAQAIALLHAESWRRHYRGAYSGSYLDGDVITERLAVWTARLADPGPGLTVLAEEDGAPVGFVHVVFDEDPQWGSLIDNLHVTHDRQRSGVGTALLAAAVDGVRRGAAGSARYLWVLEQNIAAQQFYRALGGIQVSREAVGPPGGVADRLHGNPDKLRMAWAAD